MTMYEATAPHVIALHRCKGVGTDCCVVIAQSSPLVSLCRSGFRVNEVDLEPFHLHWSVSVKTIKISICAVSILLRAHDRHCASPLTFEEWGCFQQLKLQSLKHAILSKDSAMFHHHNTPFQVGRAFNLS